MMNMMRSVSRCSTPAMTESPTTIDSASIPRTSPDELNEHALSSTEVSPVDESFGASSIRQQELAGEAANALMFQRIPTRRSSARSRPYSSYELYSASNTSLNNMLPWNTGTVPTRKISVSSIASSTTRPGPRRASTAMNPSIDLIRSSFEGLQRRPSQLSVRMRRESVAEKAKSHENLVQSPEIIGGPFEEVHASPGDQSHWSDNSDNEDDDEDENENENANEEQQVMDPESPVLGPPLQKSTEAIVQQNKLDHDDDQDGSIHISMARRVSRTASNSAMLPIFLRASRMSREASQSRRASLLSVAAQESHPKQNDLVRLVTALQSTHLEETRRLNDIIASLSTKVAALERDLVYATTQPAPIPVSAPFGTSSYPPYSSPRNSLTPADIKWKGTSGNGHYRFDAPTHLDGGCGRRVSAISASSPRTAALSYI